MRILLLAALVWPLLTWPVPGPAGSVPAGHDRAATVPTALVASFEPIPTVASFGWPLAGLPGIARPFEPPSHRYGPGHRGVDLRGSPGQPVLAAGDGSVAFAGMVAGRPVLSIDHPNGLRTTYEPVTATVTTGQRVHKGDVIGTLEPGHPGCPAVACLHWGVRRGDEYLDPLLLLAPVRVRLLPMPP